MPSLVILSGDWQQAAQNSAGGLGESFAPLSVSAGASDVRVTFSTEAPEGGLIILANNSEHGSATSHWVDTDANGVARLADWSGTIGIYSQARGPQYPKLPTQLTITASAKGYDSVEFHVRIESDQELGGFVNRKNQRNMSPEEWQGFVNAVNAMKDAPRSDSAPNYQQFIDCHVQAMTTNMSWGAHGGLNFLTWHRSYIKHFEERLKSFVPNAFIPYWNWVEDRAIPVELGNPSDLVRWGVTRNANPNFSSIADASRLNSLMGQTTFSTFTAMVEGDQFHGSLHVVVGGIMSGTASPSDPVFFLHHAFCDKLATDWQRRHSNSEHPNMSELLEPSPFVTGTNAQVWHASELRYRYS